MQLNSGECAALWKKKQKADPNKHQMYLPNERERYKMRK
jgi:hypothetical protein